MEENSEKSSRNKVQQSILSFVKSNENRSSQGSVKTRMKTQKVPKHNGSQNFEIWMITLHSGRLGPGSACAENAIFAAVTKIGVESSQVGIFWWF